MANIAPISVQINERIVTQKRERKSSTSQKVRDAENILSNLDKAADLQIRLGLGNPSNSVNTKKIEYKQIQKLVEADNLAEKFQAIVEPNIKFFPRFLPETAIRTGTAFANISGRLPEMAMVKLAGNTSRLHCRLNKAVEGQIDFEANIPVMPLTVLELASRAKDCAPSAEFHLMFMPSWEAVPQKDPVLVAHIPGTDEWFEIAAWDGDADLIKEFIQNK